LIFAAIAAFLLAYAAAFSALAAARAVLAAAVICALIWFYCLIAARFLATSALP